MSALEMTDTVWKFIDRAGAERQRMNAARFHHEMESNCIELGMESPLEHLFWIAMSVLCESEFEPFNPDPLDDRTLGRGVYVTPQAKVAKYRVDFIVDRVAPYGMTSGVPVIVELDGHAFHDKDKKQRAYEKSRDRFLVKEGYRLLHYTGSEIFADPFKVAHEVLSMLGATTFTYDPKDPLGVDS